MSTALHPRTLKEIDAIFKPTWPAKPIVELPRVPLMDSFSSMFFNFGSCFAGTISHRLSGLGIEAHFYDGYGLAFSNEAVATLLRVLTGEIRLGPEHVHHFQDEVGGSTHCLYQYPKRFFMPDEELNAFMEETNAKVRDLIAKCTHMIITMGTCDVVRSKRTGLSINRTNKMPESEYYRHTNTVSEEIGWIESILASLKELRGGALPVMICTVSPQRQGFLPVYDVLAERNIPPSWFVQSSLTKAVMRTALHEVMLKYPDEPIHYFPSYEIVIDELRSHDPFESDLRHVNAPHTVNYVVKRFLQSYSSDFVLNQLALLKLMRDIRAEQEMLRQCPSAREVVLKRLEADILDPLSGLDDLSHCNKLLLDDILALLNEYGEYDRMADILRRHEASRRTLAVWGVGGRYEAGLTRFVRDHRHEFDILLVDGKNHGREVDGLTVRPPRDLQGRAIGALLVASVFRGEILEECGKLGLRPQFTL